MKPANPEFRFRPFAYSEIYRHPEVEGPAFREDGRLREDLAPGIAGLMKNESNCIVFLKDGRWLATWGQGREEACEDQRIVCAESRDQGRSWTAPQTIVPRRPEAGERASYGIPFVVPSSGRIYLFYFASHSGGWGAEYGGGTLEFVYSDDGAVTWSEAFPISLPSRVVDTVPGRIHGWVNHPPCVMPGGEVVFCFSSLLRLTGGDRKWQLGAAEVNMIHCENILSESDPTALRFTLLPRGPRGIRTDLEKNWHNAPLRRHLAFWNGVPEETGWSFQEMTMVPLSDARWLGIGRTYLGSPGFTISEDRGETWSPAQPLCYAPGGPPIPHPMTMCPVFRRRNGSFVLLFTNNDGSQRKARHLWDGNGRTRNPQWFCVGREIPGESANAGLVFGSPRILAEVDDRGDTTLKTGISMPQFFEYEDRAFVAYNINKEHLFLDEIPSHVLAEMEPVL